MSASLQVIHAEHIRPQPWRNGGGRTRELLAWPSAQDWALRVSLADIEADGPFSVFEGVERWFAVIAGTGVALVFDDGERKLVPGDAPLCFDGAAAPGCRLLNGATRDLNLMLRGGTGAIRTLQPGVAWNESFAKRGLFTAVAGRWSTLDASRDLNAHTLLWEEAATGANWAFEADDPNAAVQGWWLGFTPKASP
jgi:uncharacterized protein